MTGPHILLTFVLGVLFVFSWLQISDRIAELRGKGNEDPFLAILFTAVGSFFKNKAETEELDNNP